MRGFHPVISIEPDEFSKSFIIYQNAFPLCSRISLCLELRAAEKMVYPNRLVSGLTIFQKGYTHRALIDNIAAD